MPSEPPTSSKSCFYWNAFTYSAHPHASFRQLRWYRFPLIKTELMDAIRLTWHSVFIFNWLHTPTPLIFGHMASCCQQTIWVMLSSTGTSYDVAIISVGYCLPSGFRSSLERHIGSYFTTMSYEHLALSGLSAACPKCTISALKIHYSWCCWSGHNKQKRTLGLLGLRGFPSLHRIILSITVNQMLL